MKKNMYTQNEALVYIIIQCLIKSVYKNKKKKVNVLDSIQLQILEPILFSLIRRGFVIRYCKSFGRAGEADSALTLQP